MEKQLLKQTQSRGTAACAGLLMLVIEGEVAEQVKRAIIFGTDHDDSML